MAVSVLQLGTPRGAREGLRIGTVRRPPRGVPKSQYASQDWYDVWLPDLAPSAPLVKAAQAGGDDPAAWRRFARAYRREMSRPEARRLLDLLAALSRGANFSVGCYCQDDARCHRSILRELLAGRGARIA